MKNVFMLGKIVLGVVLCSLLTGCGSKETKIICKQTSSGVDITFNVNFTGNVVKTMDVLYEMDLSSYNDSTIESINKQDFCSSVKEAFGDYKDGFENCKQQIKEKKLNVSADLNVDKFSDNVLDKIGSPKSTKEELEKQGYSCTLN